jgi:hypothetical protein
MSLFSKPSCCFGRLEFFQIGSARPSIEERFPVNYERKFFFPFANVPFGLENREELVKASELCNWGIEQFEIRSAYMCI